MSDQSEKEQTSPLNDKNDPLESSRGDTFILPGGGTRLRRMLAAAQEDQQVPLTAPSEMLLVVRGMSHPISFKEKDTLILGRYDHKSAVRPDVDLSRYGAAERGVSREHARLERRDGNLYVIDLGSTNGTFVRSERLTPNEPLQLRHGDEVIFGRLAVQVMFAH